MVLQMTSDLSLADRQAKSDSAVTLSPAQKRVAYLADLAAIGLGQIQAIAAHSPALHSALSQPAITALRSQAAARLPELAIPSTRDEAWRFTDLSGLLNHSFGAIADSPGISDRNLPFNLPAIAAFLLPDVALRLVFVDGCFMPELSQPDGAAIAVRGERTQNSMPGLILGNGTVLSPILQADLATLPEAEEVFTTLNSATFQDVAVVHLGRNLDLQAVPIHLLFVSTAAAESNRLTQPRVLIKVEANSQAQIIEEFVSLGDGISLTNAVSEIILAENAGLHHTRIQRENDRSFHIGKTAIVQARDSRYQQISVQTGGQLSRHNLAVHHQGEQVETTLLGLAIAKGQQLIDTHSNIQYQHPYCRSNQLYKAIVDGRSRSVFNGRVDVPKLAQMTDAAQLNRNLILSPKARIDTKPQLEIVADNVKCSHGATVSQLDDDEIFYLQSRGIDREGAQRLLIDAFANEIFEKLPLESLRSQLRAIAQSLGTPSV